MERDEPPYRNFSFGPRSCRPDHERKHAGHSDEAANCDLVDLRRFAKFFRPKAPEDDCDEKKTDRDDGIERDQPCRRHFFTEEDEISVVLRLDKISVEDILVVNDCNGQEWKNSNEDGDYVLLMTIQLSI